MSSIENPLGQTTTYTSQYQPTLLCPIERQGQRDELGIEYPLPFAGVDVWNAYELSWLNAKGKPEVAVAQVIIPCESPCLIESKSMKLYFNSLNNTQFADLETVQATLQADLSAGLGCEAGVLIMTARDFAAIPLLARFKGQCIDDQDITCDTYQVHPEFLQTANNHVSEALHSELLKSNCLVTGQPDWASVRITYEGPQIDHAGLLRYIVSYRNHDEFGEHCVERIFMDILRHCKPKQLTVEAKYTRRGGLDINPMRSTAPEAMPTYARLFRQ